MTSFDLCIYHANCDDGFGSAWVARHRYPGIVLQPARYGDAPPDVRGRRVLVVDFSYPRETLLQMHEEAEELLVLDHHKTAKEDLDGLPFCVFDMNRSGAGITWDTLFPDDLRPWLINLVEARDLWRLEGDGHLLSRVIRSHPHDLVVWDDLATDLEDKRPSMLAEGAALLRHENKQVDRIVRASKPWRVCGHLVPAVNTSVLQSEVGHRLAPGSPFAVCWVEGADGFWYLSLRSTDEGLDVGAIARELGGGGHRNAAGCKILPVLWDPAEGADGYRCIEPRTDGLRRSRTGPL